MSDSDRRPVDDGQETKLLLEFVMFCVEHLAASLGRDETEVYDLLTKDSDVLTGYLIPNYEVLHTQGKDYLVEDLRSVLRERGLDV